MNSSKILSQKTVFQSKYFRVDQVTIERNGKQFTKDIIIKNSFVIIIALTDNDEIIMVSQSRDALGKETFETVAGTMNKDETDPRVAAKRELKEETGYSAKDWRQIGTMEVSANQKNTFYIFVAKGLTNGEKALDEDEDIKTLKIPIEEVLEKVISGEIYIASNVAAILLFDRMRKEGKI